MGQTKQDYEKTLYDDMKSGIYCSVCSEEIPKSELKDSDQGDGSFVCSYCRQKMTDFCEQ